MYRIATSSLGFLDLLFLELLRGFLFAFLGFLRVRRLTDLSLPVEEDSVLDPESSLSLSLSLSLSSSYLESLFLPLPPPRTLLYEIELSLELSELSLELPDSLELLDGSSSEW
jgi:hypothetical protein